MEDFSIKAIIIGVSLFITMITFSAVFLYFNSAKNIVDEVNKRVDIAVNFDSIMNPEITEADLTGVEVRSLISKYANDNYVHIDIVSIGGDTSKKIYNVNNNWVISSDPDITLLDQSKLYIINPSWNNRVNKVDNGNVITISLELNV